MKYIQTHPEVRQRDGSRLSSVISVEKLGQKLGLWDNFPFNCHLANRDKKWKTDFHEIFMKYWSWAKGNELFMMFWFPKGLLPLIDRWPRGFDKAANYVLLPLITGVNMCVLVVHSYLIMFIAFHCPENIEGESDAVSLSNEPILYWSRSGSLPPRVSYCFHQKLIVPKYISMSLLVGTASGFYLDGNEMHPLTYFHIFVVIRL